MTITIEQIKAQAQRLREKYPDRYVAIAFDCGTHSGSVEFYSHWELYVAGHHNQSFPNFTALKTFVDLTTNSSPTSDEIVE